MSAVEATRSLNKYHTFVRTFTSKKLQSQHSNVLNMPIPYVVSLISF